MFDLVGTESLGNFYYKYVACEGIVHICFWLSLFGTVITLLSQILAKFGIEHACDVQASKTPISMTFGQKIIKIKLW